MEVLKYLVSAPPTDEVGGIRVNVTEEERHGTARADGSGIDLTGLEAKFFTNTTAGSS